MEQGSDIPPEKKAKNDEMEEVVDEEKTKEIDRNEETGEEGSPEKKTVNEEPVEEVKVMNHLAGLYGNLIFDVLKRVNLDDIDALSVTSRGMAAICESARKDALKCVAEEMAVCQKNRMCEIKITEALKKNNWMNDNRSHRLVHTDSGEPYTPYLFESVLKNPPSDNQFPRNMIRELITFVYKRFNIESCCFRGVTIDDDVLETLQMILSDPELKKLKFMRSFINHPNETRKKKLEQMLLDSKVPVLYMNISPAIGNSIEFMTRFAEVNSSPELEIHYYGNQHARRVRPGPEFADSLVRYTTLTNSELVIDVDLTITQVMKRLPQERDGTWMFRVSSNITEADIREKLTDELQLQRCYHARSSYDWTISWKDVKTSLRRVDIGIDFDVAVPNSTIFNAKFY